MSIAAWDEKYRNRGFNDSGPVPLLVKFCEPLPPGRALDLACGAGRNALWLLDRGWAVTAIDSSAAALALLRERARPSASLTTQCADLAAHQFKTDEACWDLIVVSYYLQEDLFDKIQQVLAPGGIAIVIIHLATPDRPSRFSLQPGQLAGYFSNQTILHSHEGIATGLDKGRPVAEIVVRRS